MNFLNYFGILVLPGDSLKLEQKKINHQIKDLVVTLLTSVSVVTKGLTTTPS